MSRLRPSHAIARPAAAAAVEARAELGAAVIDGRTHRPVVVPRTAIKGAMRLLSRKEMREVRAECRRFVAEHHGLEGPDVEGYVEWREERATRVVAIAVRDPENVARPLDSLEEWEECDDDQINTLWDAYQDMAAELDPLGDQAPPLTEAEEAALRAAAKKGDAASLMSYGSRRLALFAISTQAAPPPS